MANCGINFFIAIHRFSLVKAAMNARCICKLRKGVTKSKCAMNINRNHLNGCTIVNLKTRRRSKTLKGSQRMGGGGAGGVF
jgi:hypothetical protein